MVLGAAINFMAGFPHHSVIETISAAKDPNLDDINDDEGRLAERIYCNFSNDNLLKKFMFKGDANDQAGKNLF